MDVAVDGKQRNGIGVGRLGEGDVRALEVQRVMDIPDILHQEPTRPAENRPEPENRTRYGELEGHVKERKKAKDR